MHNHYTFHTNSLTSDAYWHQRLMLQVMDSTKNSAHYSLFHFRAKKNPAQKLLLLSQQLMGNSRKYPYPTTDGFHVFTPPCLRKFPNALPPPMPSEFHSREPPLPFRISGFLEVHFQLSNAYMNRRTWIYASSRLWSSGARRQALL